MGVYKNNQGSLDKIAGGTFYADSPIGTILAFGGSNVPTGWHLCDGTALSRTTYKALFAIIGTNFGVGDGSTTFNLPDLRGEFLRGAGTNGHSGQGSGGSVGEHQDATTQEMRYGHRDSGLISFYDNKVDGTQLKNTDGYASAEGNAGLINVNGSATTSGSVTDYGYYARPTNTSVNYIIKMFKTAVPVEVKGDGGNNYSTEERVIGQWIDEKPLYRKVITGINIPKSSSTPIDITAQIGCIMDVWNISEDMSYLYINNVSAGVTQYEKVNRPNSTSTCVRYKNSVYELICTSSNDAGVLTLVLEYTKTTD